MHAMYSGMDRRGVLWMLFNFQCFASRTLSYKQSIGFYTINVLLKTNSGFVLILFFNADSKANPLPHSRNKSAIGGRNLFVDDPYHNLRDAGIHIAKPNCVWIRAKAGLKHLEFYRLM